jgi:NAD(P)-dependent dehydrogenase (short-subunit alcohol dehydrogenase family)
MKEFLIIGASSGIGKHIAHKLAESGFGVTGTYRNTEVTGEENQIRYHFLDATQADPDLAFVPGTLHGVAYCAGSIQLRPFHRIKPETFLEDYNLQVGGAVRILQKVLPNLKAADQASVVLFSTVAVQYGFNFHSLVSSSKGAVEGLTRALAAEWTPAIRVNCIAPSLTDTPMASSLLNTDSKREANADRHPLKRIGNPEDIASMAVYLLTETSSWITGQVFPVDGGMSRIRS